MIIKRKRESECKQNNMIMKICYVAVQVHETVRKIFLLRVLCSPKISPLSPDIQSYGNRPHDNILCWKIHLHILVSLEVSTRNDALP